MKPLNFDEFPQPDGNDSGTVGAALEALWNASDESTANEAYDLFLWAVGNNHAGTFFPVVLGTLPGIQRILMSGSEWAQRAAIESLIDLGGSFVPDPGYEMHLGASVQEMLNAFVDSTRSYVAPLANGNDARARSAMDLVELIDDRSATLPGI
jgi:hypothetical protein